MSLFLSLSGVIGAKPDEVAAAFAKMTASPGCYLRKELVTSENPEFLAIREGDVGTTVMYPDGFLKWDETSQYLSRELKRPVFSFHIHDGALWMYILFDDNEIIDQFNPIPDYWGDIDEAERSTWKGEAKLVTDRIPGLVVTSIARYLVQWDDKLFDSGSDQKAYPEDRFSYGTDWQLTDFMRRLGLQYPIDDAGRVIGTTYRFKFKP